MTSHSSIMEVLKEKHETQKVNVVDTFPMLYDVYENVMLGSFSWYYMQTKQKDIARKFALNFDGTITTPAELARTYLQIKYKKVRATGEQVREFKRARSAPLYAKPHTYQEGVYVDIRSAYWQLLQVVGWNADYNPRQWLGRGEPMDDFPYADIKLSRNCLVTAGLPSEATFWEGKKQGFKRLSTYNRSANMGIWALIMDILHGVAWDCIAAGATYAHTDGYICDASRLSAVMGAISSWGLEARIKKVGAVRVCGVGSYSFSDQSTHTPKQDHTYDGLLLTDYNDWLKKRFLFFAERTNFKWQSDWKQESKSTSLI